MTRRRQRRQSYAERLSTRAAAPPAEPPDGRFRLPVAALVLLFVFFAWLHINSTPLASSGSFINAPDERAHVAYVEAIALSRRPPVRDDPIHRTYQWHQPPLYYAVASAAYRLGLTGMRSVSVLFGIVSLWALWSATLIVCPGRPVVSFLSVGLAALIPMRHAVLSAVGNDSATECVFSLALYTMALLCRRGWTIPRSVALAGILGVGLWTKSTCLLLLLPAAVALWVAARGEPATARLGRTVSPIIAAVVLASPWYVRNWKLYGEVLPLRAFQQEFAGTSRARDWIGKQHLSVDLWSGDLRPGPLMDVQGYATLVTNWTARTFFAAYTPPAKQTIGAPVFLPGGAYLLFYAILAFGLLGLVWPLKGEASDGGSQRCAATVFGMTVILVVGSFALFAATYFQAQGRYLYPTILPISIGWASGFENLTPPKYRRRLAVVVLSILVLLSVAFALLYVAPAYRGSSL